MRNSSRKSTRPQPSSIPSFFPRGRAARPVRAAEPARSYAIPGGATAVLIQPAQVLLVAAVRFTLQVAGGHSAVRQQGGPGDEPGLITGGKHRRGGHVTGLAHPADGRYRPVTRVFAAVLLAGRAIAACYRRVMMRVILVAIVVASSHPAAVSM